MCGFWEVCTEKKGESKHARCEGWCARKRRAADMEETWADWGGGGGTWTWTWTWDWTQGPCQVRKDWREKAREPSGSSKAHPHRKPKSDGKNSEDQEGRQGRGSLR